MKRKSYVVVEDTFIECKLYKDLLRCMILCIERDEIYWDKSFLPLSGDAHSHTCFLLSRLKQRVSTLLHVL